jgi:hypothetical protein
MPTRSGTRLRAAIATIGGLALATALFAAAPAAAASPTACRVRNLDTGVTKNSLQKAHDAAKADQRLTVRGTCAGITVLRKSLTITGIRTATSGKPILDAKLNGRVVKVRPGVKVTMRRLTIRGGATPGSGGGILNDGTLVLRHVVVRGNTAGADGGGVANGRNLTLAGSSSIRANGAEVYGGGIYNSLGIGILTMKDSSSIRANTAGERGGGVSNHGTVKMRGSSSIADNQADHLGGGVYNEGTVRMRGSSSITGNVVLEGGGPRGGGVYHFSGTLAGVRCAPDPDANVKNNTPDDCAFN